MKGHTREDSNKLKYCTHCNMQGHTKDICFQLIGYPPDWKGKKRVNMVQTSNGSRGSQRSGDEQYNQHSQSGTSIGNECVPHFTPNQYTQILQMLNKSQITESSAHMAGMFTGTSLCNVADSNCLDWIVDSGASDHMVGTTSLLNHGLTVSNPGKVQLAT